MTTKAHQRYLASNSVNRRFGVAFLTSLNEPHSFFEQDRSDVKFSCPSKHSAKAEHTKVWEKSSPLAVSIIKFCATAELLGMPEDFVSAAEMNALDRYKGSASALAATVIC